MSASSTLSRKLSEPTTTEPGVCEAPPPVSGFEEDEELPHPARNAPVRTAADAAATARLVMLEFTVAPLVGGIRAPAPCPVGMRILSRPQSNPADRRTVNRSSITDRYRLGCPSTRVS